jgi:glutamine synthetase
MRELSLLYAPNINSYKRFVPGSFAPTAIKWGRDNRTCAMRLVGHGPSLRLENRCPGGDVNPYLAVAGDDRCRSATASRRTSTSRNEFVGNAYTSDSAHVPSSMGEALEALGVVGLGARHVRRGGPGPLRQHGTRRDGGLRQAVTDWERFRSFERL